MLPDLHIGFSRGRSGGLVFPSLLDFPQFIVIHTVKGFGIVNKAEIDVFLELSCFFDYPVDVGNLIFGSSAFSKTTLNIWKFMVHVLLKPGLENFERYFTSIVSPFRNYLTSEIHFTQGDVLHWHGPKQMTVGCKGYKVLSDYLLLFYPSFHKSLSEKYT